MKFLIPINTGKTEDGQDESVTIHSVETYSNNARTNRRRLRQYFTRMGVKPNEMKRVFKEMGFTKERLTNKMTEQEYFESVKRQSTPTKSTESPS